MQNAAKTASASASGHPGAPYLDKNQTKNFLTLDEPGVANSQIDKFASSVANNKLQQTSSAPAAAPAPAANNQTWAEYFRSFLPW